MSSFLKKREENRSQKRRIHKRPIVIDSSVIEKSPAISKLHIANEIPLSRLCGMCDFCLEPQKPGEPKRCGRAVTHVNADKLVHLRDLAEFALKLYNDNKMKSFKLVKVCKINRVSGGFYGLTFRAQEDGRKECPVFRGVVHKKEALFCEIKILGMRLPTRKYLYYQKDDDEIKLLPHDDDYVSSERACEREDCSP